MTCYCQRILYRHCRKENFTINKSCYRTILFLSFLICILAVMHYVLLKLFVISQWTWWRLALASRNIATKRYFTLFDQSLLKSSWLRLVPSRYLSVFWDERRLGIRLRRERGLMGRDITGQSPDFSARRRRPNLHSNHRKSVSNNRQGN